MMDITKNLNKFIRDEAAKLIEYQKLEEVYKQVGIDNFDKFLELDAKAELLKNVIQNNGYVDMDMADFDRDEKYRITFKDAISMPDFTLVFPKTVTKIVNEASEPSAVLTAMLETIPFKGIMRFMPAISGSAWNLDIAEADEPPELTAKMGEWEQVTMGKSGVAIQLTDEVQRYSNFPVLNMLIQEAGKALKRWKEYKAANMLLNSATASVTSGSGVDASGTDNDSLSFDDLLTAMMTIINNGGNPDTIIMNPLAYPMFLMNPSLRSFFLLTNGKIGSYINWQGVKFNKTVENLGGAMEQKDPNGRQVSTITFPSGVYGRPLTVVLSPYIPFNSSTKETQLIIADSAELGYLLVEELPQAEKLRDARHGLDRFQIIERYTIVPKNKAKYLTKITGVKAVKGFDPIPTLNLG